MADLIQGISYKQLRRVSDWQMTQEAQRAALAAVVQAISRLDTTIYWGEGRTSASDGQRFALPRRILQQNLQHMLQRLRSRILYLPRG
jgi:TnpA family transposase